MSSFVGTYVVPKVEDLVHVSPRSDPGYNRLGGLAYIKRLDLEAMVADVQYIVGNKRDKEVPVADLAPIINQSDEKYEYEDEDADNDDLDRGRSMETASRWVGVLSGWNLQCH